MVQGGFVARDGLVVEIYWDGIVERGSFVGRIDLVARKDLAVRDSLVVQS